MPDQLSIDSLKKIILDDFDKSVIIATLDNGVSLRLLESDTPSDGYFFIAENPAFPLLILRYSDPGPIASYLHWFPKPKCKCAIWASPDLSSTELITTVFFEYLLKKFPHVASDPEQMLLDCYPEQSSSIWQSLMFKTFYFADYWEYCSTEITDPESGYDHVGFSSQSQYEQDRPFRFGTLPLFSRLLITIRYYRPAV